MSIPQSGGGPIAGRDDLVGYVASGEKPRSAWRIGAEHEKFGFCADSLQPLPYDGPRSVRAMLEGFRRFGWTPIREGDNIIGLQGDDGANISLEPGGQLELSGAPLENIHQICVETNRHLDQAREIGDELGVGFLGLGFSPNWTRAEIPIMPKGRYDVMRRYMPKRGNLGLDMMLRTCTVQVNLDFADEADMVKKLRVGLALQPIATALFANSPFTEGRPNGFLSYRAHIWSDTDPDRTGQLPFVFEEGFGYERWVDYILDVPMYFVYRDGRYIDCAGKSFRDFLDGRLDVLPGETPTLSDWADHMTTAFPEARVKKFIEMRGADGGPWRRLCALPALWVGLLYDQGALDAAWDLCKGWSAEARAALLPDVTRRGLNAEIGGRKVRDIARDALAIAAGGLKARAAMSDFGEDETHFLNALHEIVDSGLTPAETLLERFHGAWGGAVDPLFREFAY